MLFRYCMALIALIVLLAGFALAGEPAPPEGWVDGYVIANGIRIHYWRTGGEKPPLVLAHGSSDDGLCWTNMAKEIEGDFDIIMMDARGHGLSDPPTEADPADAMVEDLAGLIRELKLDKPIVMGHSMGSSTAAWFGAKYPDVARAIVLEDPGLGARRGGAPGDQEARRASILARNNLTYEELVSQCRQNSPKWEPSECEIWAPSKRRHHPNTAFRRLGDRPSTNELFPKITAPTLILKADAEGDVRRENEKVAALLPNGNIVHIKGAGHNVRREGKQQTLEVLKEFLAGL